MLRTFTHTLRGQILVLTALFVCSLPLVTTRIYASDEVQYYAYLRSMWFDRDVSFENEYQHFYDAGVTHNDGFHETFLERVTDTGRRNTFATIGSALLWSPFFAAADVIVHVRRAIGGPGVVEADGYSHPYIASVAYGSAVYGWLSLVLSLFIMHRVLGQSRLIAALAIWIGTPVFFYMYIAPPMSHGCSAFAIAAFVLVWLRVRTRWSPGGMIALGALAALMAMVREQDVFIAIGPAVDWAIDVWKGETSSPPLPPSPPWDSRKEARGENNSGESLSGSRSALVIRGLVGAAAFVVAYLPQLIAYRAINGYFGPARLVARKLNWMSPHAFGVLASPEHGLIFWTPLVILSLIGLAWLALRPEHRRVGVCLVLMVLSQIYVAGSVESWTVAGAFGQRRFVGLTSLFVLGLAVVIARVAVERVPRLVAVTIVAIGVWWNLGLMAQFGAGLMDRQRLELGRNAYQTFVTIPQRVPELAYRYVFARRSFFKTEPARER